MAPGRKHGLYVVDVIEGECQPVFLTSGQARDRHGGGEGLSGLPSRSQHSKGLSLSGVGLHWGASGHRDTVSPPHKENIMRLYALSEA